MPALHLTKKWPRFDASAARQRTDPAVDSTDSTQRRFSCLEPRSLAGTPPHGNFKHLPSYTTSRQRYAASIARNGGRRMILQFSPLRWRRGRNILVVMRPCLWWCCDRVIRPLMRRCDDARAHLVYDSWAATRRAEARKPGGAATGVWYCRWRPGRGTHCR